MQISQAGIDLIQSFESCRLQAYRDIRGVATIGWGHTKDVQMGMTITQTQADLFLAEDLSEFEHYVNTYVTATVTQPQFDALVSLCYNIGPGNLLKSDVLKFVNTGQTDQAADAFLTLDWAGGVEVPGLLRRREAERALFLTAPPQTPAATNWLNTIKNWFRKCQISLG